MPASASRELDEQTLERLYLELERPLYNSVYRWLWDPEDSREVVQEAFLRLWRMRERVRPQTARPLVYRIALNLAASRRRRRKLWRWLGLDAWGEPRSALPSAERHALMGEQLELARVALEGLPERLRSVVVLCELGELSYAEVAETLGIPVGTVGSRRNRALALLRAALEPGARAAGMRGARE